MANDMVAGPELVTFKGQLFYFSPMVERDLAALTAWCRWYSKKDVVQYSLEWMECLLTIPGAAQLLFISIKRNQPFSVVEAADFIDKDEELIVKIFDYWCKLNFEDVKYPELPANDDSVPVTREYVYYMLSRKFKWTAEQISLLTPYQQYVYFNEHTLMPKQIETVAFNSPEEYAQWRQNVSKKR